MDDNDFDDIIKKKVGAYQEEGFDPAALSALHHQMASVSTWPWYSRYRTELMVAGGFLFTTIIILFSQWWFSLNDRMLFEGNLTKISGQQEEIEKLKSQINFMKNLPPDTLRIIEYQDQNTRTYSLLLEEITTLKEILEQARTMNERTAYSQVLAFQEIDSLYDESTYSSIFATIEDNRVVPKQRLSKSLRAEPNNISLPNNKKGPALSYSTLRDLEKHYHAGIGIRVGPTIEFSRGAYKEGMGAGDITGGLLADFILSPALSLETGGKFVHRIYDISENDIGKLNLPGIDPSLGPVKIADVDSWILEIPINLKYRYPLSLKSHLVGGLGYSSMICTKQLFEYDYSFAGNPDLQINAAKTITGFKRYPGTANILMGLSHRMKDNKILETSLYYQYGLGETGVEKMKASFYGVRAAYWFNVR